MDGLSIRRYEIKDHKDVIALHIKALKAVGSYIDDPSVQSQAGKDLFDIIGTYIENHGEFLVVTINNNIVGMGALRKVDQTTAEIKRMRVEPSLQGRGIGGTILDLLITKAKNLGYTKLMLDVAERSIPAQKLYESRGFIIYKRGELFRQKTLFYHLTL
jgi:ribosomal protein S18 acetylase RimI-like enzyme